MQDKRETAKLLHCKQYAFQWLVKDKMYVNVLFKSNNFGSLDITEAFH